MSNDAEMDFVQTELRRIGEDVAALTARYETGIAVIKAHLDLVDARITDLERRMHISPELMRELQRGSR